MAASEPEAREAPPVTEQTPLLGDDGTARGPQARNGSDADGPGVVVPAAAAKPDDDGEGKPLPGLQIFLLCYARMMEPVAFFSIFPYIAEMVQRNGHLPDSDVGFYSGLIESLFSVTQMVVLISWGRAADRFGRKPILLASFVGMTLGPALFGLSTSILQMILSRCLAGVFSGSGLVIRTMISEHSTRHTQARAFSWFAFAGNLGIFIGPIVGGVLADPAVQYPGVFKGVRFFEQYPYALSGFTVALFTCTAAVTSALFLEETLPGTAKSVDAGASPEPEQHRPSMWALVKSPGVGIVLWVYNHVLFLAFAFTAIIPVALYTPVDLGGLGFGPSLISAYMAVQGASQALWLIIIFPPLQLRFGTKGVLKACGIGYPFFFAGYIALNLLLRDGSEPAVATFWVLGTIVAIVGPGVSMAFTGVQLALNDASPDPHVLGTLNAIALTASSGVRAIVPGVATAVYAVGVRGPILGGHLAWVILIPIAVANAVCTTWLPEGARPQPATQNENDA